MKQITSVQQQQLLVAASAVRLKAYAPYSQFLVGAAVLADDGAIYSGCNVENAAYPEGTCAEAGAIAAMVAGGGKRVLAAAVVGTGEALISPCGGCRQKLAEFAGAEAPIYLASASSDKKTTYLMAELLPASFVL